MDELTYLPFDCDNHYYEAEDAFTRHVPREWQRRCVQWCEINGRRHHIVGGKLSSAVANPTWDPIAKPGALHEYFRGNPTGKSPLEMLKDREPLPQEYMNKDARVEKIKQQGLSAVWLFPTLGVLYEELLKDIREEVAHKLIEFLDLIREDRWKAVHVMIEYGFDRDLVVIHVNYPTSRDGCWRAVIQIVRLNDDSHLF